MLISAEVRTADPIMQEIALLPLITASALKNNFGKASLQALKGPIAITRHNRAEFVLLPMEQYVDLQRSRMAPLDSLAVQFDAMVAAMNTPAAKHGVAQLFEATPSELGQSAVNAARWDNR